jgi:NADH:ubiquinone oxidoreductase subunit 6 (subunit J)
MMRKTAWIWFVGFAAWLADALLSLRRRNLRHARLALMVAIVFFTAGLFYRRQT